MIRFVPVLCTGHFFLLTWCARGFAPPWRCIFYLVCAELCPVRGNVFLICCARDSAPSRKDAFLIWCARGFSPSRDGAFSIWCGEASLIRCARGFSPPRGDVFLIWCGRINIYLFFPYEIFSPLYINLKKNPNMVGTRFSNWIFFFHKIPNTVN